MSTRKITAGMFRVGIVGMTLLVGTVVGAAPDVPYGAPLPTPPAAGGGGPQGGGRGFGGFGRGAFTLGQVATVTGSTFTVTDMQGNTVTVKTTPTTEFVTNTDGSVNDIKVGDTLSVNGRPADPSTPTAITARRITDGTVGTGFPAPPPRAPGAGGGPGGAPGGGQGGAGGWMRRFAPITGVVTVLSPLTIKSTDGTVYTIDDSNVDTVTLATAGTIDDVQNGKYALVIATPPPPPAAGDAGAPPAPPTNVTATRVTLSDNPPSFGRGGGGGGGFGGGGFGGPPPANPPAVQ